jgi:hypothetical protein
MENSMEEQIKTGPINRLMKNIVGGIKKSYGSLPVKKRRVFRRSLLILLFFISTGYTLYRAITPSVSGVATGSELSFNLTPSNTEISTSDQNIEIKVTTAVPVAFIHIEVTYDKNTLNIAGNPNISSPLTRVVSLTPPTTANQNGRMVIALALDPSDINSPPTGDFSLGIIPFKSVTSSQNVTTSIDVDDISSMVVRSSGATIIFSSYGSSIKVNPTSPEDPPDPIDPSPEPPPEPTPEPPTITSCDEYCKDAGFSAGTCRKNSGQCKKRGEIDTSVGSVYCTSRWTSTCCCK